MTNSNDALRAALEQCMKQFAFYAVEHAKAGKVEKAATNQKFADLCHNALALTPSPVAGGDLRACREVIAYSVIEGSVGIRAAEHAKDFQTANWSDALRSADAVITALAALNQPAAPVEAVAYWYRHPTHTDEPFGTQPLTDADKAAGWAETPLYAHPPEPAASTVAQGEG